MTPEQLKVIFVRRYVIAIGLIALLSTAAFLSLNLALAQSESTAMIVNVSGKQRMLSQRIASLSQQYYWNTYYQYDPKMSEIVAAQLKEAIQEMGKANTALSSGRLQSDQKLKLSDEIHEIYFGSTQLKKKVEHYLDNAQRLLEGKGSDRELGHLHHLVFSSHELLRDLDLAVVQYQEEGEKKIHFINKLEWIAWIVTLMVLMLEVIFIFQPMADKIRELFHTVLVNEQQLEEKIALRTLYLEQANHKLEQIASHDPLTGLKNRLNMEHDLEALQSHYKEHGLPYAVAMIDIDFFKKINDTYGHDAGDAVLKELAVLFRDNLRSQDSVYRAGGEEFVILLNRISHEQAVEKMDDLRLRVENHSFVYLDLSLRCTVSGGVYHSDMNGGIQTKRILKLVDEALYKAKHEGRNKIVSVFEM